MSTSRTPRLRSRRHPARRSTSRPGLRRLTVLAALLALLAAACGSGGSTGGASTSAAGAGTSAPAQPSGTLRLGYFPNLTHAPAIVGIEGGAFAQRLGGVDLQLKTFNSGTEMIEALFSGAIDGGFIGPNPAITAYAKSQGQALRIVAGTTSGGAALVVRNTITSAADLKGKTLATPGLGNTQDVALRAWLTTQGLKATAEGGGDVSIKPQDNADTLAAFQTGSIDGGWVPEPWATRLVQEGGGRVLVDERTLWPGGQFVTTHLIMAPSYLKAHPANVTALLNGLLDALDAMKQDPAAAQALTNQGIAKVTGKKLPEATITGAWPNLTFTYDPVASSLVTAKDNAVAAGLLKPTDLAGIYDLSLLNQALATRGLTPLSS